MIRSLIAVTVIAALAGACGGSNNTSGSATFTGTVKGQSFTPKEAQSTTGTVTLSATTQPVQAASIVITDQAGLCANVGANKEKAGSHYLVILLAQITQISPTVVTVAATTPGDYAIFSTVGTPSAANFSVVFGQTTDASCKDVAANDALGVSGTVHLTSASNGVYAGSYDVMLAAIDATTGSPVSGGTNEHVTGTFNTSSCAGLAPFIKIQRTFTCF